MKVLITGGAGWIGGITTRLFEEAGHDVVVFDNLSTGFEHNVKTSQLVQGDLRDIVAVEQLFKTSFDLIVHFAAKLDIGESTREPRLYYDNNTTGSLNLIDIAVKNDVKKIIFSSSATVYGEPDAIPIPESAPLRPINPYGHSKLMVEQLLLSYEKTHGLEWLAFRYFNPIGAYDGIHQNPSVSNIVPVALRAIKSGQPMQVYGDDYDTTDGTGVRDYIDVVEIARAHLMGADRVGACRAINLGSGSGYSVLQILAAIGKAAGQEVPYELHKRRSGDAAAVVASSHLAQDLIGWRAGSSLDQMVQRAVAGLDKE